MDPETWKRVEAVLQFCARPPRGRARTDYAYACAGDESLEREVRSLLGSELSGEGFLEDPAMHVAARAMAQSGAAEIILRQRNLPLPHHR